jgi:hypothetical protein
MSHDHWHEGVPGWDPRPCAYRLTSPIECYETCQSTDKLSTKTLSVSELTPGASPNLDLSSRNARTQHSAEINVSSKIVQLGRNREISSCEVGAVVQRSFVPACQSASKIGSDSLLMQFEGCLAF